MKTIKALEYKDLTKELQEKKFEEVLKVQIEFEISALDQDLNNGEITEKEFYNLLGCSKSYAESTAWFIPACYYEKNKKRLNKEVKKALNESLFNDWGVIIQ